MDDKSQRTHAANPRWLRATRIGAALPLLMLLIAVGGSALIESLAPDSVDFSELRAILGVFFPLWFTYLVIVLRLAGRPNKKALAFARSFAALVSVLPLALGLPVSLIGLIGILRSLPGKNGTPTQPEDVVAISGVVLFGFVNAAWAVAADKAYSSLPREPGDRRILVLSFLRAGGLLFAYAVLAVVLAGTAHDVLQSQRAVNEAAAQSVLRTLNTAEVSYVETYHLGFTDDLARLGPPSAGGNASAIPAYLVDAISAGCAPGKGPACPSGATTFVEFRYRFSYIPGDRDEQGHVTTYTITARPVGYRKTGQRSFFTDQSAVVRATIENRAATAQDPPP